MNADRAPQLKRGIRQLHLPWLKEPMGRYDDIDNILSSGTLGSPLTPLRESEVISLRAQYPRIPEDYLDYMREVGWGDFGDESYMIYAGLLRSDEIYDPETAADLNHILFFGDDFGGN